MSASVDRSAHHALAVVVQDSFDALHELTSQRKLAPHLKLILRVCETASSSAKRLAQALDKSPEPIPEGPPQGQRITEDELDALLALLNGQVCPDCGGARQHVSPLEILTSPQL